VAGTMLAARELFLLGPAKSKREAERNMIRAIDAVAKRLGNTRAVCRKYYVHPGLVRAYLQGSPRRSPPPLCRTGRAASIPPPRSGATRSRCCSFCRRMRRRREALPLHRAAPSTGLA